MVVNMIFGQSQNRDASDFVRGIFDNMGIDFKQKQANEWYGDFQSKIFLSAQKWDRYSEEEHLQCTLD